MLFTIDVLNFRGRGSHGNVGLGVTASEEHGCEGGAWFCGLYPTPNFVFLRTHDGADLGEPSLHGDRLERVDL